MVGHWASNVLGCAIVSVSLWVFLHCSYCVQLCLYRGEWSPRSVFDETDAATAAAAAAAAGDDGYDDIDGGLAPNRAFSASLANYVDTKHTIASEIVEILLDRGEKRRAGIGLVGRIFHRKYRKSAEAEMDELPMYR